VDQRDVCRSPMAHSHKPGQLCSKQGNYLAYLNETSALHSGSTFAIVIAPSECRDSCCPCCSTERQQSDGEALRDIACNVARPADLGQKDILLLAHLREERLGSFLIASMIASSPSIFPPRQMLVSARLWTREEA
jgi:hypothetical protein